MTAKNTRSDDSSLPPLDPSITGRLGSLGESAAAMLDAEINRQALMIAYLDDFHAMMLLSLAALPLVWLLRKAKAQAGGPAVVAD